MSDEQAKENLITAFIPLAEAIHALATSNQTAVLAEISALKDEIAKLTAIGVDIENAESAAVAAKTAAEQASARVNTLTGHVLVVRDNQAAVLAKLDALSAMVTAISATLDEVKASLPVPPVEEPEEPTEPEPEPEPEPVESAPLAGVNFAGLGNNPDVDASYTPKLGTHYRSILDRSNVDYVTRYTPTNGGKWVARIPYAAERLFSVANGSFTVKLVIMATAALVPFYSFGQGVAADAHKPGKDLHDLYEYTKEVHTYTYGNSKAIQYHGTQIEGMKQNKVDKVEFYADQKRQDSRMNAQDVRNDSQDTHINNVQNAAQIANEKADSGAVRMDGIEGSVRETNTQLAITDGRSINNAVRLDGVEGHNVSQDASIDALNDQAQVINNTINNHGDVLSNHQQQIDQLGSRMSGEIANALGTANRALKEARLAQDQSVASLAVAGHSYDHTDYGLQTAISVASFGGSTALAVGAGGKISERVFVNAAVTNAGSATGGVVSSTFRW